jgi:hypothetical protein
MAPEEQENMAAIERLLGRAIPRVMLPDFDYDMHPGELKPMVSYGEQAGPAGALRSDGGVAVAATRIAAVPRAGMNGKNGKNGHHGHGKHGGARNAGSHAVVRAAAKTPAVRAKPPSGNAKIVTVSGRVKPAVRVRPGVKTAPGVKARPGAAWRRSTRPRDSARPTGKVARRK